MRVFRIVRPFAHGFVHRVLQSLRAACDGMHFRAQKLHAVHVERLPVRVHLAHKYLAFHSQERRYGSRCHTVLPRARLRDKTRLSHSLGKKRLPQTVVYLVRARMIEIFSFQIYFRAAQLVRQISRIIEQRRSARVIIEQKIKLVVKRLVALAFVIDALQFFKLRHKRFGHVLSSEITESSFFHILLRPFGQYYFSNSITPFIFALPLSTALPVMTSALSSIVSKYVFCLGRECRRQYLRYCQGAIVREKAHRRVALLCHPLPLPDGGGDGELHGRCICVLSRTRVPQVILLRYCQGAIDRERAHRRVREFSVPADARRKKQKIRP